MKRGTSRGSAGSSAASIEAVRDAVGGDQRGSGCRRRKGSQAIRPASVGNTPVHLDQMNMRREGEMTASPERELVRRLERVERENRRLKALGLIALATLTSVFLMAQVRPPGRLVAGSSLSRTRKGRR